MTALTLFSTSKYTFKQKSNLVLDSITFPEGGNVANMIWTLCNWHDVKVKKSEVIVLKCIYLFIMNQKPKQMENTHSTITVKILQVVFSDKNSSPFYLEMHSRQKY